MDGDAMATIAVWLKLEEERLAQDLQAACARLHSADGEVVVDLSAVRRIDPDGIAAIERLADQAEELRVRLLLRGVNVEVYKVLKLAKLAPRFVFVS